MTDSTIEFEFNVVNWNIGGAKFLELPSNPGDPDSRETFRDNLNDGINDVLQAYMPHAITLQEITEYADDGVIEHAERVIDIPEGFSYFPSILVDTRRHSHQGKWDNVRKKGGWSKGAYFGQGNAILVRNDIKVFPVWSLPDVGIGFEQWQHAKLQHEFDVEPEAESNRNSKTSAYVEEVMLQSGFYVGNRDTEPRAACVLHLVVDHELERAPGEPKMLHQPLDIFLVNTHLTTLTNEREGIPEIDNRAAIKRMKQLDIVFDETISEYNKWRKSNYLIRNEVVDPMEGIETHLRHHPLWVVAGDFNFTQYGEEYGYLKKRNFLDLYPTHEIHTKASGIVELHPNLTH